MNKGAGVTDKQAIEEGRASIARGEGVSLDFVKGALVERENIVEWLREYGNHPPAPNCERCKAVSAIENGSHLSPPPQNME